MQESEIASYLGKRLSSFAPHTERVLVRFEDVNGPRGGIDVVCRIRLVLSSLPEIIAEAQQVDVSSAFKRAAATSVRNLKRLLGKKELATPAPSRRRSHKPKAAEAAAEITSATRPEAGSLIGRRVGRSAENLSVAAARPTKIRRDAWTDTAARGVSETDRKAGGGSTAARNTKLNVAGLSYALEDSARRPSRKSTRKSAGRVKPDSNLRRRQVRAAHSSKQRANRAAVSR